MKKVAIVILNYKGWKDTLECLESLYQIDYPNYDVIVVDNGSHDDSIKKLKEYCKGNIVTKSSFFDYDEKNKPITFLEYNRRDLETSIINEEIFNGILPNRKLVIIKNEKNFGFPEGNNIGIRYAIKTKNPDYILLLNNDTVVDKYFLKEMVDFADNHPQTGFLGPKVYYYKNNHLIQSTALGNINFIKGEAPAIYADEIDSGQHERIYEGEWVGGACILIKTEVILKIGVLDPKYFLCWEDVDWCFRGKTAGYKSNYVFKSKIWHKGGVSSNLSPASLYYGMRNTFYFLNKNGTKIQYYTFLVYFFGIRFWFLTYYYLIHNQNTGLYRSFLKATRDGLKMAPGSDDSKLFKDSL